MSGVNKVIVLGNLGKDPELKELPGGNKVAKFPVATSESWIGKDGQRQERTEWHNMVVWGKLADTCAQYLARGKQAYFEGRLQTRSWEDDQGQKKYITEVVVQSMIMVSAKDKGDQMGFDEDEEMPF